MKCLVSITQAMANYLKPIKFGDEFKKRFLTQGQNENRDIEETLDLRWELLRMLLLKMIDRIDPKLKEKYLGDNNAN